MSSLSPYLALRIGDHPPSKESDLAGTKSRPDRKQEDQPVYATRARRQERAYYDGTLFAAQFSPSLTAMSHKRHIGFLRLARTLMFLAVGALLLQTMMMSISQASAVSGVLPEPAVVLNGSMHYHGHLAGHVHIHNGDIAVGHVHSPADRDPDGDLAPLFCMLFCMSVTIPTEPSLADPSGFVGLVQLPPSERADGIDPGALIRPPSTPSIA